MTKIVYKSTNINNSTLVYAKESLKYITSALNCAEEINITTNIGQDHIKNSLQEIINEFNDFNSKLETARESYKTISEEIKTKIEKVAFPTIKNKEKSINQM